MASNYPTSLDNFTNPTSNDSLNSPSHSLQHADVNDAIEAIEAKLGIGASSAGSATAGHVLTVGTGGTTTWQALPNSGGLTLVKTQTIGTAVSSVTVSDAFSATYDSYFIEITGGAGSTTESLRLQLGSSTTGYYNSGNFVTYAGSSTPNGNNNGSIWTNVGVFTTNAIIFRVNLTNPFLAKTTYFEGNAIYGTDAAKMLGYHSAQTSYSAFTITCTSGNITGGTIRVYGYRNS